MFKRQFWNAVPQPCLLLLVALFGKGESSAQQFSNRPIFFSLCNTRPAKIRAEGSFSVLPPHKWWSPDRHVPTQERWQLSGSENDRFPFPVHSRISPLTNHREEHGLHSSTEGKAFSCANLLNSTFYRKISRYTGVSGWGAGEGEGGVAGCPTRLWKLERETFYREPKNDMHKLLFAQSLHLPFRIGIFKRLNMHSNRMETGIHK